MTPNPTPDVAARLREILSARSPRPLSMADLGDEMSLGENGLGFDSIAIVELLLDCEKKFAVRTASLLDGSPITVGRLTAHLRATSA